MELLRGEIYFVKFLPYTFDRRYLAGKSKFVLVLQEGEYFKEYDTVEVLLITSDAESKGFLTNVTIEKGTTLLKTESYVVCAQPYPVRRRTLFEENNVWCAGKLSSDMMDEVDEAIYIGLCMDQQNME